MPSGEHLRRNPVSNQGFFTQNRKICFPNWQRTSKTIMKFGFLLLAWACFSHVLPVTALVVTAKISKIAYFRGNPHKYAHWHRMQKTVKRRLFDFSSGYDISAWLRQGLSFAQMYRKWVIWPKIVRNSRIPLNNYSWTKPLRGKQRTFPWLNKIL